ncbi:MAG TPA: tetratricopeptide repeat protein [Pyrinomonadaceae bacterium]|jgi:tetratricopeptide (TPR) repeat protein|nr:tetratricopeptide repeat protein [Pyrinomonadaceae bacterium]
MQRIKQISICCLLAIIVSTFAFGQATESQQETQRLARVAQTADLDGRHDDAIKAYETIAIIAKSSPDTAADALLRAGGIYMSLGRFENAADSFRRAIVFNPRSAAAHNDLGEALGELKNYQAALASFQQAVNLDGHYVRARYNMGVTYERLGQTRYAEFVYRILIRDHPDFPLAYDSLAVTLSKSGRAREAIAFHQKAISLDPRDPSFYYNSAISYLMIGDVKNAQAEKLQLEKLDPAMAEHLAVMIGRKQN